MNRFDVSLDAWLFRALIALVALAPLPLGSNRPLPAALIALASGLLLALWAARAAVRGRLEVTSGLMLRLHVPVTLYLLVVLWVLVQWLPSPFPSWAHPIWEEASAALGRELAPRITVNPDATLAALGGLLTYGAIFWLTLQLAVDPGRARQARNAVVAIGGAYALYGLFAHFGGMGWIDDRLVQTRPSDLSSSFVNRNSFATFAGLALLCTAAIYIERIRHIFSIKRPVRQKLSLAIETMVLHSGWITAAFGLTAVALLLTVSRGGILASLAGLAALVMLQLKSAGGPARGRAAIIMLILIVTGIVMMASGRGLIERIGQRGFVEDELRQTIFTTTIEAIRSAPWTGTGYGTYPDAIEAWRTNDPDIFMVWEKAHNTYLENALELGLPAAGALCLAVLWLAMIAFRGVAERRRHRAFPALGVAATLLVGIHALVDFSLQIPAVAVLYAFILGLAVAQSAPRHGHDNTAPARGPASAASHIPQKN